MVGGRSDDSNLDKNCCQTVMKEYRLVSKKPNRKLNRRNADDRSLRKERRNL